MDYNKLGLDASLVEATKSILEKKLHPNQEKLDKNKNGKLDAQDFKMLRGEKVDEESEDLDESSSEHYNSGYNAAKSGKTRQNNPYKEGSTASHYWAKGWEHSKDGKSAQKFTEEVEQIDEAEMTHSQLMKKIKDGTHEAMTDVKPGKHVEVRHTGTGKRSMVMVRPDAVKEDIEQIDELSKKTLSSYANKANQQAGDLTYDAAHTRDRDEKKALKDKAAKREAGVQKATSKLTKEEVEEFMQTEEYEQLDELSKATLGSYAKKASDQAANLKGQHSYIKAKTNMPATAGIDSTWEGQKSSKRQAGVKKAIDKLTKEQVEEIETLAAKYGLGE